MHFFIKDVLNNSDANTATKNTRDTLKLTDVSEMRTVSIRATMEAVRTSETSVNFNVTTQRYIPEKSKLWIRFSW
jgi:hypothetical protein